MRYRRYFRLTQAVAMFATVCLLSAGIATAAKPPRATDRFYQHAIELLAKGDHKGAIIELKNALQNDPKDLAARVLLGNTYLEIEDGASAAKEFLRARKDGAKDSFVLAPLGRAYVLQGRYQQALKELSTAGQNQSTAAEIAVIRGDAHLALQNFIEAEKSYLEASKIRPKDSKALNGLARIKIATNDLVGAKNYVRWALEARPDDPHAWFAKGEIARLQRKEKEALPSYDRAVELAPRYVPPRLARARIIIDRGKHLDAEPDILTIRDIDPRNPHAAFLHSLILARQGKVKDAQNALVDAENILKGFPARVIQSHPPTMLLLGVVSYFRRDHDKAYQHLTAYLKRVPQHLGALKLLASLALSNGETDHALHLLERLAPRAPEDIDVLTMYGDALIQAKRHKEATRVLEKAAAIAEPGSSALARLVMLRLTSGQTDEAKKILKSEMIRDPQAVQAALMMAATQLKQGLHTQSLETVAGVIEREPKNPIAHNLAGGAHVGLKNIEAARRSFRKAFEVAPNYVLAMSNLAKLENRLGNLTEAADLYTRILEQDNRSGRAMMALAEIELRRNDLDGALRWLEKARNDSRTPRRASLRLIDLYIYANNTSQALSVARSLNSQDPANLSYLIALGGARLAAKRVKQAAATFGEVADRASNRESAEWLVRAAIWQVQALDKQGARDSLQKALKIDKKNIAAHVELFKMEMAADQVEAALSRARIIATLDGQSPVGDTLQGDAYMRKRRFDSALRVYDAALKKDQSFPQAARVYRARHAAGRNAMAFAASWADERPNDRNAQRLLALAYADSGRDTEAVAVYERLLKAAPRDTLLLNNMALLFQKHDKDRAREFAERAYEAAPSEPAVMDTYGWILVQQGDVEEGLTVLRNAKLRAPAVAEIRYHIAVALDKIGQTEEARQELRAALQSGLSFEGAEAARQLLVKLGASRR